MSSSRAAAGAVLFRETIRFSRRWQTWGLRLLFSGVILGVVVVMRIALWLDDPDASRYAEYGRITFWGFALAQYALVGLLAPVLASTGLIEEREERTLDLLAISKLSAGQILWGKLASRLVILMTVVVGTAPLLALISSMGGVSNSDVVVAIAMTVLTATMMGVVGGFVGLFAKNVLAPLITAVIWGFGAWIALPGVYAGFLAASTGGAATNLGHFSPPAALAVGGWWGLMPWLTHIPVFFAVGLLVVPAFRYSSSGSAWQGSYEHRTIDRLQLLNIVGAMLAIAGLAPMGWAAIDVTLDPWIRQAIPAAWASLVLFTWTGVVLHTAMQLLRGAAKVKPKGEQTRWWKRRVWGNPVAWRALATNSHGPSRWIVAVTLLGWLAFAGLLYWEEGPFDNEVNVSLMGLSMFPAFVFASMAATGSMLEERKGEALALLTLTTMPSWRMVTGKIVGVAMRTGFVLMPGLFTLLLVRFRDFEGWRYYDNMYWDSASHPSHGPFYLLVAQTYGMRTAATLLWIGLTWMAIVLAALAVAREARPPRLAWAINLAGVVGFFIVPLFLLPFDDFGGEHLSVLLFPLYSESWWCGELGIPIEQIVSIMGYGAMCVTVFGWLVVRMRARQ